jgi:hypothetical protein
MTKKGMYLLDTNIFIDAHQRYYAFDISPSFWESLGKLAKDKKIVSIDRVKEEILRGDKEDELCKWARGNFSDWFMSTDDPKVFKAYADIIQWVQSQEQFRDHAKAEFARIADSWLVAYALAYNHTVVTHEVYNKDAKNRVLIPNVCVAFGVPYINTFDMLRNLNTKIAIFS